MVKTMIVEEGKFFYQLKNDEVTLYSHGIQIGTAQTRPLILAGLELATIPTNSGLYIAAFVEDLALATHYSGSIGAEVVFASLSYLGLQTVYDQEKQDLTKPYQWLHTVDSEGLVSLRSPLTWIMRATAFELSQSMSLLPFIEGNSREAIHAAVERYSRSDRPGYQIFPTEMVATGMGLLSIKQLLTS